MQNHQNIQKACSGGGLGAIATVFALFAAPAFLATFGSILLLGAAVQLGLTLGRFTSRL